MAGPQRASSPSTTPRTVIPKLVTDPIASLAPGPYHVTVIGEQFTVPALPAVAWLELLMDEHAALSDFFPGLAGSEAQIAVTQAIIDGFYNQEAERTLVLALIDAAGGRPWWVTVRLCRIVASSWDYLGGEIAMRGVDATRLSLSGWLDAVFHIILRSMDPKEHTKFLMQLELVPAEVAVEQPEPEMEMDAFLSMMA